MESIIVIQNESSDNAYQVIGGVSDFKMTGSKMCNPLNSQFSSQASYEASNQGHWEEETAGG